MNSPRRLSLPSQSCLWLGWLVLFGLTARGHDTLTYDVNPSPGYSVGGPAALSTLLAMGTARLRPQNLKIDLTMADGAAYNLLGSDPYPPPLATASSSANFGEAHFTANEPRLIQRAATLFTISHNGEALDPLAVRAELTASQDIIFHLVYPPVATGALRLQLNCFDHAAPGQKAILNVLDSAEHSLTLRSLDAQAPAIEVQIAPAHAPAAPSSSYNGIKIAAGLMGGGGVLWLLLKLRQPPARR